MENCSTIRAKIFQDIQKFDYNSLLLINDFIEKIKTNQLEKEIKEKNEEDESIKGDKNFYDKFDMTGYGDYYKKTDESINLDDNKEEIMDDEYYDMLYEISNDYDYDSEGYYFHGHYNYDYYDYDDYA